MTLQISHHRSPFFLGFFLLFAFSAFSQQGLIPLETNRAVRFQYQEYLQSVQQSSRTNNGTIDTIQINLADDRVIFRDDFSDYAGWPTQDLWIDRDVYINKSFGSNPVTLGVATFDGLDETGSPYDFFDPVAYDSNDRLTSCPINLSGVDLTNPNIDSIYLSFYYQPQGLNPFGTEPGDSLILEFYNPSSSSWTQVWSADGRSLHSFRRVALLVDTNYHKNGFQFRFTNFGNRSGSVDHWHIDYVYMSSNTKVTHLNPEDMAFRLPQNTLLRDYTAMPWWHYDPSRMLNEVTLSYYYFNNTKPKSGDIKSWLQILDSNGSEIAITETDNPEFFFGFLGGNDIDWAFNAGGNINFPTATSETVNYFNYKIYFNLNNVVVDSNIANDSLIEQQVFGSYYSYDDGMAEAGFGLFGSGNMLAYAFDMGSRIDTLTSVYIYFNPVIHDRSRENFRLTVWEDNSGEPGAILHQNSSVSRPRYSELNKFKGVANFVRYDLDEPVVVNNQFYIGWEKITDDRLNVGYDVNRDYQEKIFINLGGVWQMSDSSGGVASWLFDDSSLI